MRKLQAELYEAQEGLNDTYYSHSKDQQNEALDDEANSYREAQDKYLEGLRDTLEQTEELINEKISDFLLNADVSLDTLNQTVNEHNLTLSPALMKPFNDAATASTVFKDSVNLDLSSLINEDGVVTLFGNDAKSKLEGVFNAGSFAAENFKTSVDTQIGLVQATVELSTSPLTSNLRFPWEDTSKPDGPISTFSITAQNAINTALITAQNHEASMRMALTSPWTAGTSAVNTFSSNAKAQLDAVRREAELAMATINATQNVTYPSYTGSGSGSENTGNGNATNSNYIAGDNVKNLQKILNQFFNAKLTVDGIYGPTTTSAVKNMKNSLYKDAGYGTGGIPNRTATNGEYDLETKKMLQNYLNKRNVGSWFRENNISIPAAMYAKGTLGTKRDEWAITNEPQFGDELTMYATPQGTLSFMRAGSTVVPADLTREIIDMAELGVDGLTNMPRFNSGISLMNNAINKPEIKLNIENFLRCDNVSQDTLPELKRFVSEQMNSLVKQLNYSLKKSGAR